MVRGSSPLARGRRPVSERFHCCGGIIPARAGSTALSTGSWARSPDHPRSRGVDAFGGGKLGGDKGSSPLARGRRGGRCGRVAGVRIIPARAGSTTRAPGRQAPTRDHPRSRGVDQPGVSYPGLSRGSSPLARGRQGLSMNNWGRIRIIPARAGSTLTGPSPWRLNPGSSPLARGRRPTSSCIPRGCGIIPARAGSTHPKRMSWSAVSDHPRSRGVDPGLTQRPGRRGGIIPARAGSTRPRHG